ncbi:hypothetical protein [[Eubacterium] cellulosolvens]
MRRFPHWVYPALISVTVVAIILRLIKLYEFSIWGSDSGEHYFLLDQLMCTGKIELDYSGWGLAYPYFQGMHILSSGFAKLADCSSFSGLIYIIPITAGLSVLLVFCIALRLFRDPRIGLVSAGFLAVVMPHVFSTSHPMPGSLGSFLLLACLFLLFKSYDNSKFIVLLCLTSISLIITHHMSTYFLILTLGFIILFRELFQHPQDGARHRTRLDFGYLVFLVTVTLGYWLVYAGPFRDQILARGIPISPYLVIPAVYLGIAVLYIFVYIRRKYTWHLKTKTFSAKNLLLRSIILIISGIVIMIIIGFTGVPGTNMKIGAQSVLYFIPIIILMSFMAMAPAFAVYYRDGYTVLAWLGAIIVSIIFSISSSSQELLVYRHLPYAFEPTAILSGLGMVKLFDLIAHKTDSSILLADPNKELSNHTIPTQTTSHQIKPYNISSKRISWAGRLAATGSVIFLLLICGIFSYPPLGVLSGFEEGTTEKEFEACIWSGESLEEDATVASDHRLSSMMFGFAGLNSSWEYAPRTLHGESFQEAKAEITGVSIPAGRKRLDYVLISEAIKNGVALEQWSTAEPMSDSAIQKFETEPFIKIYDNGEAQLYLINY